MTRRLAKDVKAGRGTLRASREAKTPPPRLSGVPSPPKSLKGPALEFWVLVTKILKARHQLGVDSAPALVALCQCYGERVELQEIIETEGRFQTLTTTKGDSVRKAHPAVAMLRDADARYRAWLLEFGMTDASRGGVNAVYIQSVAPRKRAAKKTETKPGERYGLI